MIDSLSPAGYATFVGCLVDVGAKGTLLLLAALSVDWLLGRRRALVRSTLWHATLAALALLPLAALCLPRFALSWPTPSGEVSDIEHPSVGISEVGPAMATTLVWDRDDDSAETMPVPIAAPTIAWKPVLALSGVAIYVFGCVAFLIRFAVSLRAVATLSTERVRDERWKARAAQWSQRLGITRRVGLFVSSAVTVPVQVGWLRPCILLPASVAASDDEATRAAVLVHELAHVRRSDYGWNLLFRTLLAFYWPHPLVWLAGRQIGQLREQACDELCVHWLGGDYRGRLIELAARLLSRRPVVSLGIAMSQSTKLARRLSWIDSSPGRPNCVQSAPARRAITVATLCLAGLLGAASVTKSATDEQPADIERAQQPAQQAETNKDDDEPDHKGPAARKAKKTYDGPVRVWVERVKRQDLAIEAVQPCTLIAGRSAEVTARVSGYITRMTIDIGDHVKTGQVLAELESLLGPEVMQASSHVAESEAEVQQAEAAVVETEALLEAAKADVDKAEANLEGATAKLSYQEKQHERIKDHVKKGQVDPALVEEHEEKLWEAKSAVKGAKSALESAKRSVRQREAAILSAQATAKVAAARLEVARSKLTDVKQRSESVLVVSPIDGVVVRRQFHAGDLVGGPGQPPLFTVADLRRMTAITQMPEREGLVIQRGDTARIFIDALRGRVLPTAVSRVGYLIDPATRTMRVELDLPNDDLRLRPGMHGIAAVTLAVHRGALSLPLNALSHDSTVRAIIDGRAVEKVVETGGRSFDHVEIVSGLKEGDAIITNFQSPEEGAPDWGQRPRVEIVDPDQPGR